MGRNARMKQLLSVLQLVRNAELVERRDTSLGVAASTLSSQGQCNLFHTLTHGTQGCSCSTPLTAWRMKRKWTTCCPRLSSKNGEEVCLCRIVRSFSRGSKENGQHAALVCRARMVKKFACVVLSGVSRGDQKKMDNMLPSFVEQEW